MRGLLLAVAICGWAGAAQALTGIVTRVSDGDTVWVRPDEPNRKPVKVRLVGIDAPERCQAWGPESTRALGARVLRQPVKVPTRGRDAHGRLLGGLLLADGEDVSAWMVREGHAWSARFHRHPGPYAVQQREAMAARRGLFGNAGAIEPWVFRQRHGACP
jgi:endonuclease YncB( thermonuclease family)